MLVGCALVGDGSKVPSVPHSTDFCTICGRSVFISDSSRRAAETHGTGLEIMCMEHWRMNIDGPILTNAEQRAEVDGRFGPGAVEKAAAILGCEVVDLDDKNAL